MTKTDNNIQKPDIAQRIAEALARTTKPTMSANDDFKSDEGTVIGEVPEHLRHLHNLLEEVGNEACDAEHRFHEAKKRHDAIRSIFFDALKQHVPIDGDEYDGIKLCTDWQVVGFKHDEMGGLGEMLAREVMGGHR